MSAASILSANRGWYDSQSKRIADFFGVTDLRDVPVILRLLPINPETNLPPEWARGCRQARQLPRFSQDVVKLPFAFDINEMRHTDIAERIAWVVENGSGWWRIIFNGLYFEDETDAFAYRMRWNEPLALAYSKNVENS